MACVWYFISDVTHFVLEKRSLLQFLWMMDLPNSLAQVLTFVPWEGRGRGEGGKTLSRKSNGKGNGRRSKSKGEVGQNKKLEEKRRKRRRQRKRGKKGGEQLKNK